MKYSESNKPIVCMMTQSTCYRGTTKMNPVGVLWHSTGAKNPTLKRYVQPDDNAPNRNELIALIGKNQYGNDWNHIERQAGLNCWIGKLADGSVATIQTMPWDYKPWGCGKGSKGSCNNGWMQFEICEDGLTDKDYFNAVYQEACEITAYYCKMYNLNPLGTVSYQGVTVPVILDHATSYKLGLGGNHGDVQHWFKKHGKTLDDVRRDVAALMQTAPVEPMPQPTPNPVTEVKTYKVITNINKYSSASEAKSQTNSKGTYAPGTYYIYNKYPDGVNGMLNISTDKTGASPGGWINPAENQVQKEEPKDSADTKVYDLNYPNKVKIVDDAIARDNKDCTKAIKKILSNNPSFDINIAKGFFNVAKIYKIDPMMAISQSILETGWFKYQGSAVTADQHNYCGLGVTSTGIKGASFDTIEDGVRAQLQHLYAYGCKDALPSGEKVLDPRFSLVSRGVAPYWQQLAGRWACPGYDTKTYASPVDAMAANNTYGQKILTIKNGIEKVEVSDEDLNLYFKGNNDEKVEPVEPVEPVVPVVPVEPIKPKTGILWKIIELILNLIGFFFKK